MLSGLAYVWIGSYGAIALSFGINVLLSRTLGPDRFGQLALLLTVSQILAVGPNASISALVRFAAAEYTLRRSVHASLSDRMLMVAPWYALAAAVLLLGAPWLAELLGVSTSALLVLLAYLVSGTLFISAAALLRAIGRMRSYGIALTTERLLALAILFAMSRSVVLEPIDVIAVFVATTTIVSVIVFAALGSAGSLRFAPSRAGSLEMWRFTLPLLATSWLGVFGTQWIDYLIIRRYLPLADLGVYALAYQLAGAVQQLVIAVGMFLLPTYSNLIAVRRDEDVRRILQRLLPYWLFAFAILLCIAIPAAGLFVPLIFGLAFSGTVAPLQVLFVATILLAIFNTFATVLTAYGTNWPVAYVSAVSVTANVALDLLLIPAFGIVGAALATVIAYALSVVGIFWIARRRLEISTPRYALFLLPVAVASLALATAPAPAVVVIIASAIAAARVFGLPDRRDILLLRRIGAMR